MSGSMMKKLPAIVLMGLAIGGVVAASVNGMREPVSGSADFSSHTPGKHLPVFAGKGQAFLHVDLAHVGELPQNDDDVAELRASIRAQKDFPAPVKVAWELPSEAHVVEGSAHSEFPAPKAGEVIEVVLKVKGFSREARRLAGVQAYVEIAGTEMGSSAVITSLPEESFEMLPSAAAGVQVESSRKPALKGKILR